MISLDQTTGMCHDYVLPSPNMKGGHAYKNGDTTTIDGLLHVLV